ncbi:FAD-dependent oxidoreductase [Kozakia baliensis]|uniref:FAD-dependent oxidoreductase n=1 Tax=Kozakia baliensis TaxID=153496 RepID=UPI00345BB5B4
MSETEKHWVDVMALADLEDNVLTAASLGETPLVLLRIDEEIRAFGGKCPHKGAPLEQGAVCKDKFGVSQIVCPWHKACFSAESGRLIEPLALDPLPAYPVEIHDGRVLVGSVPRELPAPNSMRDSETAVIVGAGAAGVTAVVTLREEGFAGRIVLISPESDLPYDRTALSKMVLGSKPEDLKIPPIRSEEWYEANNIERLTDKIDRIDIDARTVYLHENDPIQAEHILLATGSVATRLNLPGADLKGVHVLRTAKDAKAIVDEAGPDQTAVLIGASFITMEAAAALRKRGVGVTVISRENIPFESKFGHEIGTRMRQLHEANGVAFVPDCEVKQIGGGEKVEWVLLDDHTKLNADFVIAGIGVKPIADYVKDHHAATDGGIDVDDHMRVAPGVYAAGDIAHFPHDGKRYRIEHWRTAQCQARLAARTMLGLPADDLPTPWFWTQQYDKKLEYVGWPEKFDAIDFEGDLDNFDFLAKLRHEGKIVGVIGAGRAKQIAKLAVNFNDA